MGFALKCSDKSAHERNVRALYGGHVGSSAEDAHIGVFANLYHVLADDGTEIVTEKNKLSAAIVVMNIIEDRNRIRNKESVTVLFADTAEQLEFGVTAVTAEIVDIGVKAVLIEKIREMLIALAVFGKAMNEHHAADGLFGRSGKNLEDDLVLVFPENGDGAFVHEKPPDLCAGCGRSSVRNSGCGYVRR